MRNFVQILTTPTADTPGTTLLLHFDSRRYLVGAVGEGTQRAAVQMGARLVKTSCMFLTGRTEWASVGGVLGMVLTLADGLASQLASILETGKGKKKLDAVADAAELRKGLQIVGPRNLTHMIATSRRFIFRQGMPITPVEVKAAGGGEVAAVAEKPFWEDGNVQVWALATAPEDGESQRTRAGSLSGRKRSFDEFSGGADAEQAVNHGQLTPGAADLSLAETEKEHDDIRQGVVASMFNSDWKLDHLQEMTLAKVQLPASIFTKDPDTNKLEEYKGPMPSADASVADLKVWIRRPWPGALIRSLPPTKPAKECVSYIFRNHFQRGTFKKETAEKLGVHKTLYKNLAAGESVTTEDGRTVSPSDVLQPGRQGTGFAVIDIPSVEYVGTTIARREWKDTSLMNGIKAFIWLLGPGVLADPKLQGFFKDRPDVEHIVSSVDNCPNELAMDGAALANKRLHQVDPDRYCVPIYDNDKLPQRSFRYQGVQEVQAVSGVRQAQRGTNVMLEPKFEVQEPKTPPTNLEDGDGNPFAASFALPDEVQVLRDEAYQRLEQDKPQLDAWATKLPCPDAESIALGTGSALPSKYRNVSSTLVRVPGIGSYLLDCGENTIGQLQRVYSPEQLTEVLRDLRMIWISHLHADHHLGTASMIKAWYEVNHPEDYASNTDPLPISEQPFRAEKLAEHRRLAVISDTAMLDWLAEYARAENFGNHLTMPFNISNAFSMVPSELRWAPSQETSGPLAVLEKDHYESLMGFSDIQAVPVHHCHGAKAVSITFPNGFKVSYSGDCRPSKRFASVGRDSTVLIHEATFDDELKGEALAKQHSTTSEALTVASEMRAKSVVLTHFSQRYQKIPVMESVGSLSDDEEVDSDGEMLQPWDRRPSQSVNGRTPQDSKRTNAEEDAVMEEAVFDMAGEAPELGGPTQKFPKKGLRGAKRGVEEPEGDHIPASTSDRAVPSDAGTVGETHVRVKNRDMKVCVAFDYMRVKVGDIAKMEYFTPALMKLFEEVEKPDKSELDEAETKGQEGDRRVKKSKQEKKKNRVSEGGTDLP